MSVALLWAGAWFVLGIVAALTVGPALRESSQSLPLDAAEREVRQ